MFLPRKSSFITAAIFATGSIGSGVFLESYSSITSFASLGTLLFALFFLVNYLRENKLLNFLIFLLCFVVSALVLQARSISYIIPPLVLFLLESKKITKKLIIKIVITLTVFFLAFQMPLQSNEGLFSLLFVTNYSQKLADFIKTLDSILHLPSMILIAIIGIYVWFNKKDKNILKLAIISTFWIVSMYMPYALRSDGALESTHRYLIFIVPGLIMLWSVLHKFKVWKLLSVVFIIVSIVFVNNYFSVYQEMSVRRRNFYQKLHQYVPNLKSDSVLYFDFAPDYRMDTDFLRVGYTPAESAVGTEFGIDYKSIKVFTQSQLVSEYIQKTQISYDKLFVFSYDKNGLNNLSDQTLDNITVLPAKFNMMLAADLEQVNIQKESPRDYSKEFEFLGMARAFKLGANAKASSNGEGTEAKWMLDSDPETYWLANRQDWFDNSKSKPVVSFEFNTPRSLNGFWFNVSNRSPSKIELLINGEKTNFDQKLSDGRLTTTFTKQIVTDFQINILETQSGDSPILYEIEFVPSILENVDLSVLSELEKNPLNFVKSQQSLNALSKYAESGIPACLQWQTSDFGSGEVPFVLFVDSSTHNYSIDLPSMGGRSPQFKIGCTNLPIKLSWQQQTLNPLYK